MIEAMGEGVDAELERFEAGREVFDAVELVSPRALGAFDVVVGTVSISVCGRRVEHHAAMALVKRSPKMTANCALAMDHSRGGIFHSFSERFKTRNKSFIAASSVGKWPLARTARRSLEFRASIAFVV